MKCSRLIVLVSLLLLLSLPLLSLNSVAGTEDAEMKDLELKATPSTQGLGGEVEIEASVSFFGGCCYPLFAYDIEVVLDVPENVDVVKGDLTQKIGEVKALEGGAATVKRFHWTIKSMIPGSYNFKVNVTTKNCGDRNSEVLVNYVEGLSMSIPVTYPDNPTTGKDTFIKLEVQSGLEGIEVEAVRLFYIKSTQEDEYDEDQVSAANDTFNWRNGNKKGSLIVAEELENTKNTWKISIPGQDDDCTIYYWIVAQDNTGKNTTGVVYSFEVQDFDRIYFMIDVINWLPIIITVIGIIVIGSIFNRINRPSAGKGVLIIGSKSTIDLHEKKIDTSKLEKLNLRRNIAILVLLIFSIVLLIWSIYTGYFIEFAKLNGGI
jgi:hypothetical protein